MSWHPGQDKTFEMAAAMQLKRAMDRLAQSASVTADQLDLMADAFRQLGEDFEPLQDELIAKELEAEAIREMRTPGPQDAL